MIMSLCIFVLTLLKVSLKYGWQQVLKDINEAVGWQKL